MYSRRFFSALFVTFALAGCSATPVRESFQSNVMSVAAPSRSDVRAMLANNRARQIERLHAYAQAGVFPHNYASIEPLHMFKDDKGRLCAVANLVDKDGLTNLVNATARERNDVALADVKDGPLNDWAIASGLTIEEIARIQRPAPMIHLPEAPKKVNPTQTKYFPKPRPSKREAADVAVSETVMKRDVGAHFATVEAELQAATDKSLDIAVDRWFQARSVS